MSHFGEIETEFRGGFRETGGKRLPAAISAVCSTCGDKGVFTLKRDAPVLFPDAWHTVGPCPACSQQMNFFIGFTENGDANLEPTSVATFPSSSAKVVALQLPNSFPDRVAKAIRDAEESARLGLYSPALTCGGIALEGLFYHLSSNEKKARTLEKTIEEFVAKDESVEPLKKLSHAIRKGRNIGAHFDVDIEPTEQSAVLVIELLHYIVTYFYLLPPKIEELEKLVAKQNSRE